MRNPSVADALNAAFAGLDPPRSPTELELPWLPTGDQTDGDSVLHSSVRQPDEEVFVPDEEAAAAGRDVVNQPHWLAWYKPLSIYGSEWGIHYHTLNIRLSCSALLADALRSYPHLQGSLSLHAVELALYALLRQHETFHARVELAAAHWTIATNKVGTDPPAYWAPRGALEEACATAAEMSLTRRPRGVSAEQWTVLLELWKQKALMLPPYSQWPDADAHWPIKVNALSQLVGGDDDGALFLALDMGTPLQIPQYDWVPADKGRFGYVLARRGFSRRSVSCVEVHRVLSRPGLQAKYGYKGVNKGKHRKFERTEGPPAKVPVHCHRNAPWKEWGQIASLLALEGPDREDEAYDIICGN